MWPLVRHIKTYDDQGVLLRHVHILEPETNTFHEARDTCGVQASDFKLVLYQTKVGAMEDSTQEGEMDSVHDVPRAVTSALRKKLTSTTAQGNYSLSYPMEAIPENGLAPPPLEAGPLLPEEQEPHESEMMCMYITYI